MELFLSIIFFGGLGTLALIVCLIAATSIAKGITNGVSDFIEGPPKGMVFRKKAKLKKGDKQNPIPLETMYPGSMF